MPRAPRFTEEQSAELRKKYESGMDLRMLAAEYGADYTTIREYIVKAGGQMRPKGTRAGSKNTPTKGAKARAQEERDLKWREKYESGMTLQEIANEEGEITYVGTISRAIQRVGGTMRPAGYVKGSKKKPMTPEALERAILQLLPSATFKVDDGGQLVIYTGLKTVMVEMFVPMAE